MIGTLLPDYVVDRFGWLLIHSLWQFTLIALGTIVALRMMRHTSATARYWVCLAALMAMAAGPAISWRFLPEYSRPEFSDRLFQAGGEPREVDLPIVAPKNEADTSTALEPARRLSETKPTKVMPSSTVSNPRVLSHTARGPGMLEVIVTPWLKVLVAAWSLGVLLFALRPTCSFYTLYRLRRIGVSPVVEPVKSALARAAERVGVRRSVTVLQSSLATVPMVVGYLRPVILLPVYVVSGLSSAQIEAILAHELAHVRRHDYLVNLFQIVLETICFYHPAVWWLSARLRQEREHCCDELAASAIDSRAAYGRALLALEELRGKPPVLALGATSGSLVERIQRLRAGQSSDRAGAGGLLGIALLATTIVTVCIGSALQADGVSSDSPRTASTAPESVTANDSDEMPAPGTVQGILVKASDGTPVGGARIILRGSRTYHANSDANGRFRLRNIPPKERQYEIWAYAKNLVTAKVQLDQKISDDSKTAWFAPLRLEMTEGKRVAFDVTSAATGQPLKGAVVRFGYPDRRMVETAQDGTAVVEGLLAQLYEVTIEAEGHARSAPHIDLSESAATTKFNAPLDPGGVVRGRVINNRGLPVNGARVLYRVQDGVGYYGQKVQTGSDGRFENRYLPLDTAVQISVDHDDYTDHRQQVVVPANDRELEMDIVLDERERGVSIAGTVKDAKGNPIGGARIANYSNRPEVRRENVSDAQGAFSLEDLFDVNGGYTIHVAAKGFAPQRVSIDPTGVAGNSPVEIVLEAGHTIRGQVVDASGKPLGRAIVFPRGPALGFAEMGEVIRTRDDGGFAFDSLPGDVRFDVSHPGHPHVFAMALPLDGEDPVIVTLPAPGILQGQVIDAKTKRPITQFRVRLGFSPDRTPDDPQGTFDSKWGNPGLTFDSSEGRFVISPLQPGMPLEMTVFADGYDKYVASRAVANPSEASQPITVPLTPADPAQQATLVGQIFDHAGLPVPKAQLRLIVSTDQSTGLEDNRFNWELIKNGQLGQKSYCDQFLSTTTDSDGQFEFRNISPGKHLQLAYWGPGVPQGRKLDFDETRKATDSVKITVPQPARIRGTIDRARFPTAGSIRAELAGDAWHQYTLQLKASQPEFALDDLPPGDYTIYVGSKPEEFTENGTTFHRITTLATQRFRLQPGDAADVEF